MKITGGLVALLSFAILANGLDKVSFLEPNCGISILGMRNSRYRIIGGATAVKYGNPWMALIKSNVECGGSLITARFVLSAAHCMTGRPTTVYLGEFDRTRITANVLQVAVDAQIPHPLYTNTKSDIKNDIGLFRLARTIQYTDFIKPVCLPVNYNPLAQTKFLTATGWGKTEHGIGSNVLKTTTLTQQNRGVCSSTFRSNVDMSQICAGAPNSHTCSGDSGGPITSNYSIAGRKRVIQLGIVSYGDEFCRTVGVYTNVMHYMGWIRYVIQRSGGQSKPAPTQKPNHNNNKHNNNHNPNQNNNHNTNHNNDSPKFDIPIRKTPIEYDDYDDNDSRETYYYHNENPTTYYYPNVSPQSYYYPNGNYYIPTVNNPVYYYPAPQNYLVYG